MHINPLHIFSQYSIKKSADGPLFLSVIIPTFNRESAVETCLSKLKESSFEKKRMEVIIVDDCSTDCTFQTLLKHQNDFSNISLLKRKENSGGASLPRNNGIQLAAGKWLLFVDSDDYLTRHAISDAADIVETDETIDMVCMPYFRSRESTRAISQSAFSYRDTVTNLRFYETRLYNSLNAVGKLFKHSLINDHSILFPENIKVREDNLFMMKAYSVSNNISILGNRKEYYFCNEKDAISLSSGRVPPRDATTIYLSAFDFVNSLALDNTLKANLLALYLNRYTDLIKRGKHSPERLFKHTRESLNKIRDSQYLSSEAKIFIEELFINNEHSCTKNN